MTRSSKFGSRKEKDIFWETLQQLSLSNKKSLSSDIFFQEKKGLAFGPFPISEVFQKLYSNIPSGLVKKLPAAVNKSAGNKFGLQFVEV